MFCDFFRQAISSLTHSGDESGKSFIVMPNPASIVSNDALNEYKTAVAIPKTVDATVT